MAPSFLWFITVLGFSPALSIIARPRTVALDADVTCHCAVVLSKSNIMTSTVSNSAIVEGRTPTEPHSWIFPSLNRTPIGPRPNPNHIILALPLWQGKYFLGTRPSKAWQRPLSTEWPFILL